MIELFLNQAEKYDLKVEHNVAISGNSCTETLIIKSYSVKQVAELLKEKFKQNKRALEFVSNFESSKTFFFDDVFISGNGEEAILLFASELRKNGVNVTVEFLPTGDSSFESCYVKIE
ncbi:MAG: hypothetical protein PHH22_01530 [Clostridia bacterium]|nr:hypothetical protein [Clostridia bacterium]